MEIGVLIDREGNVSTFDQGGIVTVYSVEDGGIRLLREKKYESAALRGAPAIRESLRELGAWLGNCRVLVSGSLNGIYFTVLEGMLFNMWEMTGKPLDFLDYICKSELEEQEKARLPEKVYAPAEKERGVFFIDLEAVMSSDSGVTSKKVLLPFLKKENFKKLEVRCSHIPRWFDTELAPLKLRAAAEKRQDGYLVSIVPESL